MSKNIYTINKNNIKIIIKFKFFFFFKIFFLSLIGLFDLFTFFWTFLDWSFIDKLLSGLSKLVILISLTPLFLSLLDINSFLFNLFKNISQFKIESFIKDKFIWKNAYV